MRTKETASPAVLTWIYVVRVYYLVARCAEQELKAKGMTLPRFDLIAQLGVQKGCCTQDTLCEKLMVTKGHVSGLIERMVKEGWVSRETDPSNRRCNRIQLTPRGHRVYEEVMPKRNSCMDRMFSKLNRRQQMQLTDLLRKLLESVQSSMGGD
jgi:MarR family 2-MHQ and catechol resistance regulon transcriptional repressor